MRTDPCTPLGVTIPLRDGCVLLIDDADYADVAQWSWHCVRIGTYHQPRAWIRESGHKPRKIAIGRYLLRPEAGFEVDHINGDTLDNRRENLRLVTKQQNQWNQRRVRGSVPFKGVKWDPKHRCYSAGIRIQQVYTHLGHYAEAIWAAHAYDRAAVDTYGTYAACNFPDDIPSSEVIESHRLHRPPIAPPHGRSRYRGVDWHRGRWRAKIMVHGTKYDLGRFSTELEAARAYDAAVDHYQGEPSRKNFPDDSL